MTHVPKSVKLYKSREQVHCQMLMTLHSSCAICILGKLQWCQHQLSSSNIEHSLFCRWRAGPGGACSSSDMQLAACMLGELEQCQDQLSQI